MPRRRPDGPRREEQVRAQRGDPLELDTVGFAQHLGQGGTAKLVPRPRVAGAGVFAKPLRRADRCDPECQQGVCSTSPTGPLPDDPVEDARLDRLLGGAA
ncbi:MAG: hypothetical protein ACRDYA_22840 [Egibacteraceae bacterium]